MRDVAGTLVRHAIVAEKGVSDVVRTFEISGGGPVGAAGVVVVAVVVSAGASLVAGGAGTPGRARNLRSLT
jgi:hypothetical protein